MAKLLTGDLAQKVFNAFDGKLLDGVLRQKTVPDSGALDDYGDPIDEGATRVTCQGFVENYSDFYHGEKGIPDTDLKVNIFAKSIDGIKPLKGWQVRLDNPDEGTSQWYQIRKVRTDPATALWTCQSFEIDDPDPQGNDVGAGL